MKNPLENLHKSLGLGLVLTVLVFLLRGHYTIVGDSAFWLFLFRYIHVFFGILWIGLLYYFNFVQIPSMPKIPDEQKPAIGKVIAPAALFFFRMAANVWFVIWPNQKKALGIVTVDADAKKAAARLAMLASRTNTMLSLPMLYCMVG